MKAMILAAGLGTRLRPLTDTIPKPLLPVGGTPLLIWNLLLLRAHEIREVMINLHYLGNLIEKEIGDGSQWGMQVFYSHETEILGTGGGVKAVEDFFEGQSFLLMNGDTLIELDVKSLVTFHDRHAGVTTMVLRDDPHAEQWGAVESTPQDRILRINGRGMEGTGKNDAVISRMFAGVHILHPSVLQDAPCGVPFSIIDSYTSALAKGSPMFGFVHTGYWSDIGTLDRYAQAQRDFEAGSISLSNRTIGV